MATDREEARLAVSRNAARLFLEQGVAGTSGDDIAAASGLSKRTIWRYFRTKESCIEPLLSLSVGHFLSRLRLWPRDLSIEAFLEAQVIDPNEQGLADYVLAARVIALLPEEPPLRSAWLMACDEVETELVGIVRARLNAPVEDVELRLCAASIAAGVRVIDEDLCHRVIKHFEFTTPAEVNRRMAGVIRAASTLPICDAVEEMR